MHSLSAQVATALQEESAVILLWFCSRGDQTSVSFLRVKAQAGRQVPAPLNTYARVSFSQFLRPPGCVPRCAQRKPFVDGEARSVSRGIKGTWSARHHEGNFF